MDIILIAIWALMCLALIVAALAVAWWLFRMVFWIAILFIGEAGRAWRGD